MGRHGNASEGDYMDWLWDLVTSTGPFPTSESEARAVAHSKRTERLAHAFAGRRFARRCLATMPDERAWMTYRPVTSPEGDRLSGPLARVVEYERRNA